MSQTAPHDWDRHAATYARLFAPLTGYIAQSMLRLVDGRLPRAARVLDVACGSGALALPAARRALAERSATGAQGLVVATDFSPGMVELTRRAGEELGAGEHLRCEVQDGEALGYADASFDAAFSSFGIFLFGDRRAGWREAARVLRPGGLFATAAWRGPEHNPMLREQMLPLVAALPERLRRPPQGGWMEIAEASALVGEVAAAGFVEPEVTVFHASLVLPDPRTAWLAMQDNPVMGAMLRACEPDELAAVEASVVSSLGRLSGGPDRPLTLDSSCHILVARRDGARE